jgi:hypothetical protein
MEFYKSAPGWNLGALLYCTTGMLIELGQIMSKGSLDIPRF